MPAMQFRALNTKQKDFFDKIVRRAAKCNLLLPPTITKEADYYKLLEGAKIGFDIDGNFTICVLRIVGGHVYVGAAKRKADDVYKYSTGLTLAFRSAVNRYLGVSNEYSRKHLSRQVVDETADLQPEPALPLGKGDTHD